MQNDYDTPYFQTQQSFNNICGVHAINNLLGYKACTQKDLDAICTKLSSNFINPHKHFFGGDYDANIILIALQNLGYQCKWLDSRNEQQIILDFMVPHERRVGYIINRKLESNRLKKLFGLSGRHWVAIKFHKDSYYDLDSKAQSKQQTKIENMECFLSQELANQSHIIEVVKAIPNS